MRVTRLLPLLLLLGRAGLCLFDLVGTIVLRLSCRRAVDNFWNIERVQRDEHRACGCEEIGMRVGHAHELAIAGRLMSIKPAQRLVLNGEPPDTKAAIGESHGDFQRAFIRVAIVNG